MVLFNYSTKELTAKIVYYGPGLCGKTTNLQYIFNNLPDKVNKGKMLSLATQTDRTLFFDFLPIELGTIRGMKTRLQLYTVPGQVFYNTTRKLVLKGADGIVFVADSQRKMLDANVESFGNLEENLKEHGMVLADLPHIIQFNKRDLADLLNPEELNSALNKYNAPIYEAVATTGIGVQDTLKAVTRLVLNSLKEKYGDSRKAGERKRPAAVAAAAAAAPVAAAPPPEPPPPVAEVVEEEPVLEISEDEPAAPSPEPTLEPAPEVMVQAAPAAEVAEEEPVLELSEEEATEAVTVSEIPAPEAAAVTEVAEDEPVLEISEEPVEGPVPAVADLSEEPSPLQVDDVSLDAGMPPEAAPAVEAIELPVEEGAPPGMDQVLEVEPEPGGAQAGIFDSSPEPLAEAVSAETVAAAAISIDSRAGSARTATVPISLEIRGETVRLNITITINVDES